MTTYVRLDQIRKAFTFTDDLTASQIQNIETTAVDSEDFLGGILSQFNKVIGVTNWFDPVQNAALQPRNLKTLTDDIYYKDLLRRRQVLAGITVPTAAKAVGTINHVSKAELADGDNFVLNDDQNAAVTFYFDVTGTYTPPGGYSATKIRVLVDTATDADSVKVIANDAINNVGAGLLIAASSGGTGITSLLHDQNGSFNVPIIENVTDTDFTVDGMKNGAGNAVTLTATAETPTETAAVDTGHAEGAVVKTLSGDVGLFSLEEVGGLNSINPKNLTLIRDSATQDPIMSSGVEVYGLLQAQSGVVDGNTFDNSTKKVQISFVKPNATYDDLEMVPAADIAGQIIDYSYASRAEMHSLNEQDFLVGAFQDPGSFAAITLQQAYIGGNTITVSTSEGNLTFNLSEDLNTFVTQRNGSSFLTLLRDDTSGDKLTLDADLMDINLTGNADYNTGIKVGTTAQTINLGVTTGQIDTSTLLVQTTSGDLTLEGADDVAFKTVRETTALPLDDATAGQISALPGGPYASISAAIRAAITSSQLDIYIQTLANNYAQDENVPGATETWTPTLSLTSRTIDMNSGSTPDTLIFLNGVLLRGGNGTTNNDVYKGTTPANGDLKYDFTKGVKTGDWVTAMSWKSGAA